MICASLDLYLQHEKGAGTPYRRVPSTRHAIFANTVANLIAALPTSGEGKDRPFMTQFPVILLNGLSFPFPIILLNDLSFLSNDVIMPRPLGPSSL